MKKIITLSALLLAFAVPALAGQVHLPDPSYKKVSSLVSLPDFLPGMGTLYVKPSTLPVGPFLAYGRDGKLVSTIFMVPLADMNKHMDFSHLAVGSGTVKKVDVTFNGGHPGVEGPHYHITIWHVNPDTAKVR